MPVFVAVIGNRNSGKSTIIRSLTGCINNSFRGIVQDNVTKGTVEVICSSPQESPLALAELRKRLKRATKATSNGMICALQPTRPSKRLWMEQVLQEAIAHGYTVLAFVLDPAHSGAAGQSGDVNVRLKALGLKCTQLDARRFAHLSAVQINRKTKLIR